MVYSLLILEDEIWVSALIRNLLETNFDNIAIVGEARDGLEALELVKTHRPHILLADINVPHMNGLDLIDALRDLHSDCICVIISGYKDFEYVQRALSMGVIDYILKPVDDYKFCMVINKICSLLEQRRQAQSNTDRQNKLINAQLLKYMIYGEAQLSSRSLSEKYGVCFGEGQYQCAIVKVTHHQVANLSMSSSFMEPTVALFQQAYESEVRAHCIESFYLLQGSYIVLALHFQPDCRQPVKDALGRLFEQMFLHCKSQYMSVTLAIGGVGDSLHAFAECYNQARKTIDARFRLGTNRILAYWEHLQPEEEKSYSPIQDISLPHFRKAFYAEDNNELQLWISEIFRSYSTRLFMFDEEFFPVLELCAQIIDILLLEVQSSKHFQELNRTALLDQLEGCDSITALRSRMQSMLTEYKTQYLCKTADSHSNTENAIIKQALIYITNHLHQDLSLDEVAAHVHLTATYFSELFKKETGVNYKKYVIDKRLELATTLLKSTNDKISIIAPQCGYKDQRHFAKSFRKHVGITPKEYRRLHW